VDAKIVTEALERALANRDLFRQPIDGVELVLLPHLKRAKDIILGRIRSLSSAPSAFPAIDLREGGRLVPAEALRHHPDHVARASLLNPAGERQDSSTPPLFACHLINSAS